MTVGIIITTYGYNYIFAKQTLLSFQRHLPSSHIVLYINGTTDSRLQNIRNECTGSVDVVLSTTPFEGGLTWTWNDGIQRCIEKGCSTLILSNDDVIVTRSVHHIVQECERRAEDLVYFGPLTNEPGNANNRDQKGLSPIDKAPYICRHDGKIANINGFFMAFSTLTLYKNRLDETHFFDPKYPFERNEVEWFHRFMKLGGVPIVVPRTFIYHYKLKSWRPGIVYKDTCVYTVNIGGYEGNRILLSEKHITSSIDLLYFTDQEDLIYPCLQKGILPFLILPEEFGVTTSKILQRTIKTSPHLFLPPQYTISIYVDGNLEMQVNNLHEYPLNKLTEYDLICFAHPRKPPQKSVLYELEVIVKGKLATREQIMNVLSEFTEENYNPEEQNLTETNMLIRKHHHITAFSEDWTRMIHKCQRDQASFDFLRWKHRVKCLQLPIEDKKVQRHSHVNPIHRNLS